MNNIIEYEYCEEMFAKISDDIEIASKYISIFIDEAELSLDDISDTLLALESGGNKETLKLLMSVSHRIKGSAASVGLNRAAKMAHLMEDILQQMVERGEAITPRLIDAMLQCTDGLREHVQDLKQGPPQEDQFARLAHKLALAQTDDARAGDAAAPSSAQDGCPLSAEESGRNRDVSQNSAAVVEQMTAAVKNTHEKIETAAPHDDAKMHPGKAIIDQQLCRLVSEAAPAGSSVLAGVVVFQPDLPLSTLKAQLLYEKLLNLGEVCFLQPSAEALETLDRIETISFGLISEQPPATVKEQLSVAGVADIALHRLDARQLPSTQLSNESTQTPPGTASPLESAPEVACGKKNNSRGNDWSDRPRETLRVDIARLDRLMNLAGELVINKARFSQIGERLVKLADSNRWTKTTRNVFAATEKTAAVQDSLKDLVDTIHQLDRISDAIQKSVMDTRMVAIGPLFNRFKRVVRDITRSNGKNVRLLISGEKTELDKRMVDELADPLIHMVRNAADHGIENPSDREASGKPIQGTISLSAFQRGNSIIVQVSDDGHGMDIDRLAQHAVKRGLMSTADVSTMSARQIAQLAWEPGLSTADTITEVSGRGMGMDIVRSKVEELNGSIDLDTTPGRGTKITVKLPLTLAILPSLMVEVDGDVLAMPIESVAEIVSLDCRKVETLHGKPSAQIRGRVVSLVRLDEIFDWQIRSANVAADNREENAAAGRDETRNSNHTKKNNQLTLVVVAEQGQELALVVDRVIGEEDIVIKSMADNYRNVAGISGASILGNGRVSLILDIVALIEMCLHTSNANNER